MKEQEKLIKATGLDPEQPYSLGNKDYYYERRCNSGHTGLTDEQIGFASGMYDGYRWTVPVCRICIGNDPAAIHSHNNLVHLVETETP